MSDAKQASAKNEDLTRAGKAVSALARAERTDFLGQLIRIARRAGGKDLRGQHIGASRWWPDAVICLTLIALGLSLMGPVLGHFSGWLYGIGADGTSAPAGIAQRALSAQTGGLLAPLPILLGAPFPYPSGAEAAEPLTWYASVLVANALGPVGAANILVLTGLALTAVAMYLMLRWGRIPIGPALIGALVYGFCPSRLAQAQEHFPLIEDYWFILEGVVLILMVRRRRVIWAIVLGGCLALVELANPYLGYFAGILAGCWLTWHGIYALTRRDWANAVILARDSTVALLILAGIILPTQHTLVVAVADAGGATHNDVAVPVRSLEDLNRLSLRWWDFLLPSPGNPIIGPLGKETFFDHLGGDTVTEQSTMVGYVALGLAVIGLGAASVITRMRTRDSSFRVGTVFSDAHGPDAAGCAGAPVLGVNRGHPLYSLALVSIIGGIVFGLPPHIDIGRFHVMTPPLFMHVLFPEIRTTSRIDLLIQFGVAILAALGVYRLSCNLPSRRSQHLLIALLCVVISLEYVNVPPWRSVRLLPAPPLYEWLKSLSPQQAGIVAQYPIAPFYVATTSLYAFFAYAVHHHPLFNGVVTGTPADALRRNVEDPLNPTTPGSLASLGVKTVTLDDSSYGPLFANANLTWSGTPTAFVNRMPAGLRMVYQDRQARGYRVEGAPASLLVGLSTGFGDTELQRDGREWRWLGATASVMLDNVRAHPVTAMLWTLAHNNRSTHSVEWTGYAAESVTVAQSRSAVAIAVDAPPGLSSLTIHVAGPVLPLEGSSAAERVSLQLRSIEPAPVRTLELQFGVQGQTQWELLGASIDACTVSAGQDLSVALIWRVEMPTANDETVFVHLVNTSGALVAQADGQPDGGTMQTSQTASGSHVVDVHTLHISSGLVPGSYAIDVGLYDRASSKRLTIPGGGDTVAAANVTVEAPSDGPQRIPCSW